jgi:hypothetical protein
VVRAFLQKTGGAMPGIPGNVTDKSKICALNYLQTENINHFTRNLVLAGG